MFFRSNPLPRNTTSARRAAWCEPLERRVFLAADLVATEIVGRLPETMISGQRGRVPALGVNVTNSGDAPVRANVVVRLFASADGVLDGADAQLVEQTKRLNLKQGKSRRIPIRVRDVPGGIPQGTYRLLAFVDATNVVPEDNDLNNTIASQGSISIGPAFVDLAATRVFVRPPVRRDRNAALLLTVINNGNDDARGTGLIRVTFTRVGQTTPEQPPIDVATRINIKSLRTKALKGRLAVPATLAAGDYTVTATMLSTLPFADANTANNSATLAVAVR